MDEFPQAFHIGRTIARRFRPARSYRSRLLSPRKQIRSKAPRDRGINWAVSRAGLSQSYLTRARGGDTLEFHTKDGKAALRLWANRAGSHREIPASRRPGADIRSKVRDVGSSSRCNRGSKIGTRNSRAVLYPHYATRARTRIGFQEDGKMKNKRKKSCEFSTDTFDTKSSSQFRRADAKGA